MAIEIRRAKKKQGRWWIIALNGREIYREATAKEARRFKRGINSTESFWLIAEPLETS